MVISLTCGTDGEAQPFQAHYDSFLICTILHWLLCYFVHEAAMKPTLKQIAEKTGYSISTISRSLANSPSISKKTRDEVHREAREIGYRSTARKRRQRKKKKTLHFAFLSEYRIGEFYASMFCGYRDASYKEDVRISLLSVRDQRKECVQTIQQIHKDNQYDGFILFFPALERAHYEEILKVLPSDFPVVSNALIDNPNIATITFDGYNGGRLAAAHFHELGYRRLGIIEGPAIRPESRFRSNGFLDYVQHQPDLELTWRFSGNYEFQSGIEAFQAFRKGSQAHPADAIFAANDSMATGFMEEARAAGLRIPDDVVILGYDNLPTGIHRKPRLSSIDTDFIELGISSIKTLKNKISKQGYKHGTLSLIPVHLVQRESTERK
ncbi:MAG: LacI family transcriptional regulator [Balneolaceae bacterium]|nr:MAG: LacI family transcriptional regulator [Balneolaceae bacterium]